eukprot:365346-Chlamydomonas_euryale.AAC.6
MRGLPGRLLLAGGELADGDLRILEHLFCQRDVAAVLGLQHLSKQHAVARKRAAPCVHVGRAACAPTPTPAARYHACPQLRRGRQYVLQLVGKRSALVPQHVRRHVHVRCQQLRQRGRAVSRRGGVGQRQVGHIHAKQLRIGQQHAVHELGGDGELACVDALDDGVNGGHQVATRQRRRQRGCGRGLAAATRVHVPASGTTAARTSGGISQSGGFGPDIVRRA